MNLERPGDQHMQPRFAGLRHRKAASFSQVRRGGTNSGMARPSSANCTWTFVEQPLSHWDHGAGAGTYKQRLCIFSSYWGGAESGAPILFYTGNESPVEEYVNNTGLMWNLAAKLSALIVFAEHRYFGESVPQLAGKANCIAYLTSAEALADFAALAQTFRDPTELGGWGASKSALIAFGGSYGGMLAAEFRIKYPSLVQGAIAASAPMSGFPMTGVQMDSSYRQLSNAATTAAGLPDNSCYTGLKAAMVFLHEVGKTVEGRSAIGNAMGNLCVSIESHSDIQKMMSYLTEPLFELAEGDYPFSSDYITYALSDIDAPLPPWPFSKLCESVMPATQNLVLTGSEEEVKFTVRMKNVSVSVDWATSVSNGFSMQDLEDSGVLELLNGVKEGIQVWYNVTGTSDCVSYKGLAGLEDGVSEDTRAPPSLLGVRSSSHAAHPPRPPPSAADLGLSGGDASEFWSDSRDICYPKTSFDSDMGWYALSCNDPMNLLNYYVQGTGKDLFWPPNVDPGFSLTEAVKESWSNYCKEYMDYYGYTGSPPSADAWDKWVTADYGLQHLTTASNIVFSNGELDPWAGAGVPAELIKDQPSLSAPLISKGAHHLDLFFPTPDDPPSVVEVRQQEEDAIKGWIQEWSQVF